MCSVTAIALFMCDGAASALLESSARAQTATRSEAVDRFAKLIEEASGRFAVPASWVRAVMHIESGGDEHATSPRGAMGLMQLMPATWVELSVRYGLGVDPFDARDNIVAGTAYQTCTIVSVRQASLQPITRVQRGMNGISRRVDRFRKKPPPTLRRSRHYSVTVRVNSRQFASGE